MRTNSPCSSTLVEKPSLMILSARAASPTLESVVLRKLVPTAVPIANDATTKASQAKTAVFQWLALQRPIRAAMLLECLSGDIWDLLFLGLVVLPDPRPARSPPVGGQQASPSAAARTPFRTARPRRTLGT